MAVMKSVRNTCTESKAGRGERKKVKFGEMLKRTDICIHTCFGVFNLRIGSIGNYVCLDKTRVEHDKVSLPDKKKLGIAIIISMQSA